MHNLWFDAIQMTCWFLPIQLRLIEYHGVAPAPFDIIPFFFDQIEFRSLPLSLSNVTKVYNPQNDCVIILDDNDRKEICRLRLNRKKVYLGVFDETRKETRNRIGSLDDFYTFAEQIKATTQRYLADKP